MVVQDEVKHPLTPDDEPAVSVPHSLLPHSHLPDPGVIWRREPIQRLPPTDPALFDAYNPKPRPRKPEPVCEAESVLTNETEAPARVDARQVVTGVYAVSLTDAQAAMDAWTEIAPKRKKPTRPL
ncbi:MAG: hypothetical protein WCK65_00890 [Rhodospirillaceae bacterium]